MDRFLSQTGGNDDSCPFLVQLLQRGIVKYATFQVQVSQESWLKNSSYVGAGAASVESRPWESSGPASTDSSISSLRCSYQALLA